MREKRKIISQRGKILFLKYFKHYPFPNNSFVIIINHLPKYRPTGRIKFILGLKGLIKDL